MGSKRLDRGTYSIGTPVDVARRRSRRHIVCGLLLVVVFVVAGMEAEEERVSRPRCVREL